MLVLLLFVTSIVVASAKESLVSRARASARAVKRWGGIVLILVGAWFVVLAIWAERFAGVFPV